MASNLPYLASPASIANCLQKIRNAATPDRVNGDFVNTILQIKGGTGAALIPFLKRIGMLGSAGEPTELYKRFRNQSTGGTAIADAIKIGYRPLSEKNEYFFKLKEAELKDLLVEVMGLDKESAVLKYTFGTLKHLFAFADFDGFTEELPQEIPKREAGQVASYPVPTVVHSGKVGLNLSYTINLNLPVTTDQAVFNAIFKSLKEHLLSNE